MAKGNKYNRSKSSSKSKVSPKREQSRDQAKQLRGKEADQRLEDMKQVVVTEFSRPHTPPHKVVVHYGPTNSGKTHGSRERMLEKFEMGELDHPAAGVYAAPLRMLAQENYENIGARIGFENVGLITGEESINPTAPIICVTCEMTPRQGKFLIVDEAHWLADSSRGAVWTNAIARTSYTEMHIISAFEAKNMIEQLIWDANQVEVVHHTRFNELMFEGDVTLADIPERSAVVGFSKKLVHMIAQRLIASGKNVSVLYGNLPPHSRREQIAKFVSGETDYMVTTDVIGHGVNLPIDNVVFAETTKYDGRQRRPLRTWEIGQIAGRAGRYDKNTGRAYALVGIEKMEVDTELLKKGVEVANGTRSSDLNASAIHVAPRLDSLGFLNYTSEMSPRLTAWSRVVSQRSMIRPVHLDEYRKKMELIETELKIKCGIAPMSRERGVQSDQLIHGLWRVLSVPVEHRSEAFLPLAIDVLYDRRGGVQEALRKVSEYPENASLELLEKNVNTVRDLRMISHAFSELGLDSGDDLAYLETYYSEAIDLKIMESISETRYGHCVGCDRDVAPWVTSCSVECEKKSRGRKEAKKDPSQYAPAA
jgi:ATP-dependent RNA helicase SUPV3L1/SUV3